MQCSGQVDEAGSLDKVTTQQFSKVSSDMCGETERHDARFRLLDLPGELRELIYHHSAEDPLEIDTAAIKDHGMPKIPLIAQLCRDVREEALAVYYRRRELKLSLHSERNVLRGMEWFHCAGFRTVMPCKITMAGVLKENSELFHLTIRCSNKEPQFLVETGRCSSGTAARACRDMRIRVSDYLSTRASCKTGEEAGKLYGNEMAIVFDLVRTKAEW